MTKKEKIIWLIDLLKYIAFTSAVLLVVAAIIAIFMYPTHILTKKVSLWCSFLFAYSICTHLYINLVLQDNVKSIFDDVDMIKIRNTRHYILFLSILSGISMVCLKAI